MLDHSTLCGLRLTNRQWWRGLAPEWSQIVGERTAAAFLVVALACPVVLPAPANAALPCANPTADPCLINSTVNIPVGVYDIRPRSLSVGNKQITVTGATALTPELKILANNITFQPGARFIAGGTNGNTTITLDATGTIDIQSQGTSKSKIDVSGNFGGGTINLHSVGKLGVNGPLIANATNVLGYGGPINILSDTGNVTISGDPSDGLKSFGNAQGSGGTISIQATLGAISISTQIVPKGGDCGSCEIDLTAGTDITTTAQGLIDMRASGEGDGGFFSADAGGNINMAGDILANGSSDDLDGGSGGDVLIEAGGSVTMGGRIELNGAGKDALPGSATGTVDGDGGSIDISAGTTIQMTGPMFGIAKGFGQGDEFSFDAGGNITFGAAAGIDMSADEFSGDITVTSNALITVNSRLRSAAPIDPVNKPSALGGTVDIEGCQINLTSTGSLVATGPGGDPSGANVLVASTGMTIAGQLTATAANELTYRTTVPVITRTPVPAATLVQSPDDLPCCGVQCPTTTSTSTTSTTMSPGPTTTSTSTTRASTTSTTSSTSMRPTTTSTTSTSTSSSTSSSSSTRPTTSTSTTSTTTTSTRGPSTTSTTLAMSCPPTPTPACKTGTRVQLVVNERNFGKEQVKVVLDRLPSSVPVSSFGDPIGGMTSYAICIYDQRDMTAAALRVNRPHEQCGTRPCWKALRGMGYKYTDKLLAADGVLEVVLKSGAAGTGKVIAKGKRNLAKGLTALPIGVAAKLTSNRHATVQILASDAGCFGGTVTRVTEADGTVFRGMTP